MIKYIDLIIRWVANADAWEDQIVFLGAHGYRCIARYIGCHGANRLNAKVSQGLRDSFWLQGMQAEYKAVIDCIKVCRRFGLPDVSTKSVLILNILRKQ